MAEDHGHGSGLTPGLTQSRVRLLILLSVLVLSVGMTVGVGTSRAAAAAPRAVVTAVGRTPISAAGSSTADYWHVPGKSASRATWRVWSAWEAKQMRQQLDHHFGVPSGCKVLKSSLVPGSAAGFSAPQGTTVMGGSSLMKCSGDIANSTIDGTAPRLPAPPELVSLERHTN